MIPCLNPTCLSPLRTISMAPRVARSQLPFLRSYHGHVPRIDFPRRSIFVRFIFELRGNRSVGERIKILPDWEVLYNYHLCHPMTLFIFVWKLKHDSNRYRGLCDREVVTLEWIVQVHESMGYIRIDQTEFRRSSISMPNILTVY